MQDEGIDEAELPVVKLADYIHQVPYQSFSFIGHLHRLLSEKVYKSTRPASRHIGAIEGQSDTSFVRQFQYWCLGF